MNIFKSAKTALRVFRKDGPRAMLRVAAEKIINDTNDATSLTIVKNEDALNVVWSNRPQSFARPPKLGNKPLHLAWIMSPPGETSGGHQNLFRFIDFAEKAGHTCTIYLYSSLEGLIDIASINNLIQTSPAYPHVNASLSVYDPRIGVDGNTDVIFATGWETAYPSFRDASAARRLYFVQDFEPLFYASGSESILAENTYRFGFQAITAGGWLSHKLKTDYGMWTAHFDFGVEHERYFITNDQPRHEVFFYARPVTPRRGFELGVMALEIVATERPDAIINLAGWDVSGWNLPFAHNNLGGVSLDELNDLYNRCAAGLVVSTSNMSLLPLELLAAGAVPVVNDAENNRMVTTNPYIDYVNATPRELADGIIRALDATPSPQDFKKMKQSLEDTTWERAGAQFLSALKKAVNV